MSDTNTEVSTNELTSFEIAVARASDKLTVDRNGYGTVPREWIDGLRKKRASGLEGALAEIEALEMNHEGAVVRLTREMEKQAAELERLREFLQTIRNINEMIRDPLRRQVPMTLHAFPAPSCAYLREEVASWYGMTGKQLQRSISTASDHAAWFMREHRYSWSKIAKTIGYRWAHSAAIAARRWERMRGRKAR